MGEAMVTTPRGGHWRHFLTGGRTVGTWLAEVKTVSMSCLASKNVTVKKSHLTGIWGCFFDKKACCDLFWTWWQNGRVGSWVVAQPQILCEPQNYHSACRRREQSQQQLLSIISAVGAVLRQPWLSCLWFCCRRGWFMQKMRQRSIPTSKSWPKSQRLCTMNFPKGLLRQSILDGHFFPASTKTSMPSSRKALSSFSPFKAPKWIHGRTWSRTSKSSSISIVSLMWTKSKRIWGRLCGATLTSPLCKWQGTPWEELWRPWWSKSFRRVVIWTFQWPGTCSTQALPGIWINSWRRNGHLDANSASVVDFLCQEGRCYKFGIKIQTLSLLFGRLTNVVAHHIVGDPLSASWSKTEVVTYKPRVMNFHSLDNFTSSWVAHQIESLPIAGAALFEPLWRLL